MLKVVYEDNDILVIDKPSGMVVHPSKLHQGDTLSDEVRNYLGESDESFVFRCLTRLDKDTSGLVLLAKNKEASQKLNAQMVEKQIVREYEAVVEDDGSMPDEGTIDAPIDRLSDDEHDIRRCVSEAGEKAVTHYRIKYRGNGMATVSCILETGRTHQIRVHMAYIGHPIIGDKLYNPNSSEENMMLCMVRIEFLHPVSKKQIILTLH